MSINKKYINQNLAQLSLLKFVVTVNKFNYLYLKSYLRNTITEKRHNLNVSYKENILQFM